MQGAANARGVQRCSAGPLSHHGYRGAAHGECNLKLRIYPKSVTIPVFCHNLKHYDAHLIMREIGKVQGNLKCIPNNMEKYITFSLGELRLINQHLSLSLAELVKAKPAYSFNITRQYWKDEDILKLLLRKGVYPYEYMDSVDRFNESSLPKERPKDAFYSSLIREHITDEDYAHVQMVWEKSAKKHGKLP